MKKLVMTVAVLACASSVFSADAVTSANIVGYNKAFNTDAIQIVATQFDTGDNTPEGVFGDTLPVGSKIYAYKDGSYVGNISTYGPVFLGGNAWNISIDLGQATSYWVEVPSSVTNIISGEVYLDDAVTNSVVPGLQMLSYPYPVQRSLSQLGFTPTVGDKIYKYENGTYVGNIATYGPVFLSGDAWNIDLTFNVGDGFWYESVSLSTNVWIENRPFTP